LDIKCKNLISFLHKHKKEMLYISIGVSLVLDCKYPKSMLVHIKSSKSWW